MNPRLGTRVLRTLTQVALTSCIGHLCPPTCSLSEAIKRWCLVSGGHPWATSWGRGNDIRPLPKATATFLYSYSLWIPRTAAPFPTGWDGGRSQLTPASRCCTSLDGVPWPCPHLHKWSLLKPSTFIPSEVITGANCHSPQRNGNPEHGLCGCSMIFV